MPAVIRYSFCNSYWILPGRSAGGLGMQSIMDRVPEDGIVAILWGTGKGSGVAMVMFLLGVVRTVIFLVLRQILKKYSFRESLDD